MYSGRKVRCWTIGSRRAATAAVADRRGDALAAIRRESIWRGRSVSRWVGWSVGQLPVKASINWVAEGRESVGETCLGYRSGRNVGAMWEKLSSSDALRGDASIRCSAWLLFVPEARVVRASDVGAGVHKYVFRSRAEQGHMYLGTSSPGSCPELQVVLPSVSDSYTVVMKSARPRLSAGDRTHASQGFPAFRLTTRQTRPFRALQHHTRLQTCPDSTCE